MEAMKSNELVIRCTPSQVKRLITAMEILRLKFHFDFGDTVLWFRPNKETYSFSEEEFKDGFDGYNTVDLRYHV